ncbi:MAG: aldehyde dehydrogenase [Pseudolabrys sp.]|nr:aldehyde dehydrogenase [Pseudolabrys sp.]MDP2296659.1 aldehyde dehydrogenase [Pseudolabrys sp.]
MNVSLLINGADVTALDNTTFDRLDPFTGSVASTSPAGKVADVNAACDAAAAAFPAWSETGPNERRKLLLKAADLLEAKTPEFIKLTMEETGATGPWSGFNVMFAAKILREAACMTTMIHGEVIPSDKPGCFSMGIRQPAGVCVGMAPWNAPVILGVRAVAMPLACGNTVVMKASETCPATHMLIGKVLQEAGLPKGVINIVTHAREDAPQVVEALIAHPAVRRINFTGSSHVGRIVAQTAAKYLKPVLLELGGKAPLLVLDDAHIDDAVDAAAFGAFMHMGQICMSTERIIVDNKIADAFVDKLAAKANGLPYGDPRGKVVLGSLVSAHSADRMQVLLDDAVKQGAKLVAGGKRSGTVWSATLLDHVNPQMKIYREESFGPVKSIIRVDGDDEAVSIANDTEYGLSSAVFSQNIQRAMGIAKRIKAGICHINGPTVNDEPQMPFGGTKDSGYGRFGGTAAIAEFTELRWITIESHQHYPF